MASGIETPSTLDKAPAAEVILPMRSALLLEMAENCLNAALVSSEEIPKAPNLAVAVVRLAPYSRANLAPTCISAARSPVMP